MCAAAAEGDSSLRGGIRRKVGGKARVWTRIWIVPGCLALSVAHLRWSVIHTRVSTHTNVFTRTKTESQNHMHTIKETFLSLYLLYL